jgi:hypothetical protein
MKNYNHYNKILVFNFGLFEGGIGDNIKFFIYLLQFCIQHHIRLHYLVNHILNEKYLRLKYEQMYISNVPNPIVLNTLDFNKLNKNTYYLVRPHLLYPKFTYDKITMIPNKVFYFHEDVISNSRRLLQIDNYISIHVRLGDKYLEIKKELIQCKDDIRQFDENKIFKFIEDNDDKNIILFSDNKQYKTKLKHKYNKLIILDTNIGHTALRHTTEQQVLDTITEFYIMSNSKYIYIPCDTGFSIMASKFNNIQ